MTEKDSRFDDIRPYYDDEIPSAMQRIAGSDSFGMLAGFIYPDMTTDEVRERIYSYRNAYDYQSDSIADFTRQVIARTMTDFTVSGMEKLEHGKSYLFVCNHRDIVVDSCLLQYMLLQNGFESPEITFGANLMQNQLLIDIGRSNKMFRVERAGTPREFYASSLHLSEYIRHCLLEKHQSVWIAQRNGRTKDGIDRTDQGIIKMFGMSGNTADRVESIASLNIVPVTVSYEWESCDILKAVELYVRQNGEKYVKKAGEDVNSILTGIMGRKGSVHLSIGDMLTASDLEPYRGLSGSQFNRQVAWLVDSRICAGYRLTPNNWIACDLLSGGDEYRDRYSDEQLQQFKSHMLELDSYGLADPATLKRIFLGIYANPVLLPPERPEMN